MKNNPAKIIFIVLVSVACLLFSLNPICMIFSILVLPLITAAAVAFKKYKWLFAPSIISVVGAIYCGCLKSFVFDFRFIEPLMKSVFGAIAVNLVYNVILMAFGAIIGLIVGLALKPQSKAAVKVISVVLGFIVVCAPTAVLANGIMGNPVTAAYTKIKITQEVKKQYPNAKYEIDFPQYNLKDNSYVAEVIVDGKEYHGTYSKSDKLVTITEN